jgi:hypothetical protein
MNSSADNTPPRERRLDEAIAEYLEAAEVGRAPAPEEWLARHPDLADDLRAFLADRAGFVRAAGELAPPALPPQGPGEAPTLVPTEPPPASSPLGTVRYFGDYELLDEVARGAMGVVYRARQISLNRLVALKMILAGQLASEADVRRFRTEAEAAANLDHPNIVPIYEVGEHEGQHYFSMKLIDGGSLDRRIAELSGNSGSAAQLVAIAARAVHHAHQRGILHRDLKPANVLIDADGQPHVTDFGLAKRLADGPGATQLGAIVGTPAYMPPEQARAEKLLTTAADVYSLGAILYELLTGRPPFRAATPLDTILQVLDQEPAPPVSGNPKVDADLAAVALKCLDKNPNRRYVSAAALAEELERWQRGEPVQARPTGRLRRRLRWLKLHPAMHLLVTLGLFLPALSALVLWSMGEISASAAGFSILFPAVFAVMVLYFLPDRLAGRLALEQRRVAAAAPSDLICPNCYLPLPVPTSLAAAGERQAAAAVTRDGDPAQALPAPVPSAPPRLGNLTSAARGAAEGLVAAGLLLAWRVFRSVSVGPPAQVTWPHLHSDWYWNYLFQAALMTGLARAMAPRPLEKRVSPPVFVGLLFVALMFDEESRGIRYLFWPLLVLLGVAFGAALVYLLVARSRDPAKAVPTWGALKGSLSMAAFLCPVSGFLLGELVAGAGPPAAYTVPLHGAMAGLAVGMLLDGLNPWNRLRSGAPAPAKGQGQEQERPGTSEDG